MELQTFRLQKIFKTILVSLNTTAFLFKSCVFRSRYGTSSG